MQNVFNTRDKFAGQTQQNEHKTYNVTSGLHVSTLTESSSGPHDDILSGGDPPMPRIFFVWICIVRA